MTGGSAVALDALFRSNAAARPETIALCDPPDRADWTDGKPRILTYAETDAAVERLARRLRALGVADGAVVAVQLPNIVEGVITLLALLRARLVAAPVPMLWRRSDLVAALARVDAKAFITLTRVSDVQSADIACEVAGELFHLSFPCAFGDGVPDGMIPLDLDAAAENGADLPKASTENVEAVAIATFDAAPDGCFAVGRNHGQWLAAGLATLLEARIEPGDRLVTTLPPGSLAGIGGAFVPWLLSGGSLQLVNGYSLQGINGAADERSHLLAPSVFLPEIAADGSASFASCIAVHRAPEAIRPDTDALPEALCCDLVSFGEIGSVILRREPRASPRAIPLGVIPAPSSLREGPMVIETRIEPDGVLALRGPMVPMQPFPEGNAVPQLTVGADGFVRTGYHSTAQGKDTFVIDAAPERVATMGGLRFGLDELEARIAGSTGDSRTKVVAVPDALLGARLRIELADPKSAAQALEAAGHSRLVIEALTSPLAQQRAIG